MGKKPSSFADKMKKEKKVVYCKKCGGAIQPLVYVKSEWSDHTNSWKFKERAIGVCKCNQKEIYG